VTLEVVVLEERAREAQEARYGAGAVQATAVLTPVAWCVSSRENGHRGANFSEGVRDAPCAGQALLTSLSTAPCSTGPTPQPGGSRAPGRSSTRSRVLQADAQAG
jgi:hypothetical protein